MSVNLPSVFAQQFATTFSLLSQQKGSVLRGAVTVGSHVGKQASPVDQMASISMLPVTTRFGAMGRVDAAVDRRWVFPLDFELPQLADSFDMMKMLNDPKAPMVQNAVMAAGRQIDAEILNKFNGTNKTGESAGTSTTFPSGYKVSVSFGASGSVKLSFAKLREAKRLLMANNVDIRSEELYCIVNAKHHDALLQEIQITSADFNGGEAVLKEGMVTRVLGINILHTELIEASSTSDLVPVFCKSGVYLGLWNDIETSVDQRADLSGKPWQAYLKMSMGATRLEEKKCIQIACYNA